jgi:ribose/xylose/arabinose/galactoside ABC-type transport system permease subunit
VYAIGSSIKTAEFSGIPTARVLMTVYIAMALLAALTAIVMTSRVATARADMGSLYLMQCISAVVLGGIGLTGGKGKVTGTILGVCIFAVLANGLNLSSVTPFVKDIIQGALLIFVLLMQTIFGLRLKFGLAKWFGVLLRKDR